MSFGEDRDALSMAARRLLAAFSAPWFDTLEPFLVAAIGALRRFAVLGAHGDADGFEARPPAASARARRIGRSSSRRA